MTNFGPNQFDSFKALKAYFEDVMITTGENHPLKAVIRDGLMARDYTDRKALLDAHASPSLSTDFARADPDVTEARKLSSEMNKSFWDTLGKRFPMAFDTYGLGPEFCEENDPNAYAKMAALLEANIGNYRLFLEGDAQAIAALDYIENTLLPAMREHAPIADIDACLFDARIEEARAELFTQDTMPGGAEYFRPIPEADWH